MVNLGPLHRGYQPPPRMQTCPGFWPDRGTPCKRPLRDGTCSRAHEPDHIGGPNLDPRWEWTEITTVSSRVPEWMKGACKHLTPDPVQVADPLTGDMITVSRLCPDCDQVLWRWGDDDLPEPNGFEKWAYAPSPATELAEDLAALAWTRHPAPPALIDPMEGLNRFERGVYRVARACWSGFLSTWDWIKSGWGWAPVFIAGLAGLMLSILTVVNR